MATRIISFANQKGGVGKTTTAVNLSACIAEKGRNVLLIDLDPQGNATSGLGLEKAEGGSIYAPLLGERPITEVIIETPVKKLSLIPSELDLAGAEIDVARMDRYLHRLQEALAPLIAEEKFDYIFIDCPPSLGILTMNALAASHSLLIPLQCEYFALEGLSVITSMLQRLRESAANPDLELEGIVMTMYDSRTNLSQQVVQEVLTHFGDKIYETLIPRSVRLSEAPSFGKPIIHYDSLSTGAAAYRKLAKEFLDRCRIRKSGPGEELEPSEVPTLSSFVPKPAPKPAFVPKPIATPTPNPIPQAAPEEIPPTQNIVKRDDGAVWR